MTDSHLRFARRSFLTGLGASALLLPFAGTGRAGPGDGAQRRYVGLYFNGAWDVLLGLDPRDPGQSYSGIDLDTDRLPAEYREPIPVMIGGQETLLGSSMSAMARHADVMTIFRGVPGDAARLEHERDGPARRRDDDLPRRARRRCSARA